MSKSLRRWGAGVLGVLCLGLAAAPSEAGQFVGNPAGSTKNTGSNYAGEFVYNDIDSTSATLTINLDNTTPAAVGGFLTAFVFNVPDAITSVTLSSASPSTMSTFFFDPDNIKAAPFSNEYDAVVSTGGNASNAFEGSGPPSDGIAPGDSGTFAFDLTGTNLDTLSQSSFFLETPDGGPFFVVRFRGLTGGGSDKVPATRAVPEPGSMVLAGLGLTALAAVGLRRRRGTARA